WCPASCGEWPGCPLRVFDSSRICEHVKCNAVRTVAKSMFDNNRPAEEARQTFNSNDCPLHGLTEKSGQKAWRPKRPHPKTINEALSPVDEHSCSDECFGGV